MTIRLLCFARRSLGTALWCSGELHIWLGKPQARCGARQRGGHAGVLLGSGRGLRALQHVAMGAINGLVRAVAREAQVRWQLPPPTAAADAAAAHGCFTTRAGGWLLGPAISLLT